MRKAKASDTTKIKLAPYIKLALDNKITDAVIIKTSEVITAPWVRMKCQFGCAGYGKTLCCPPHTPTPEEMRRVLDSYSHALLLHLHWTKDYKMVNRFNDTIVVLERTIFLDGSLQGLGPWEWALRPMRKMQCVRGLSQCRQGSSIHGIVRHRCIQNSKRAWASH